MSDSTTTQFGDFIADRLKAEHVTLAARWLEQLLDRLPVDTRDVFPGDSILDHIPSLIDEIGTYLRGPEAEAIAANTAVIAKAQELGELRHSQQASVHQLLGEYRLLGNVLTTFLREEFERLGTGPTAADATEIHRRLQEALWTLTQTTVDTFVAEYTQAIEEHASRLEGFHRLISHELRQPLGTLMFSVPLVKTAVAEGDRDRQQQLLDLMDRNLRSLMDMMQKLEVISHLQVRPSDQPDTQEVALTQLAREVGSQLREMAEARAVEIRIGDDLPVLVTDIGRLELTLVNLLSNAIKYSDPAKSERYVAIETGTGTPDVCQVLVRDNGLGIPAARVGTVFQRFVRAHRERDGELQIRGSGLGLAIVADCVNALGGRVELHSVEGEGTTVALTLPREAPRRNGPHHHR